MTTDKEKVHNFIKTLPDTLSYEGIIRELFFYVMIERGLKDSIENYTITDQELTHRIKQW